MCGVRKTPAVSRAPDADVEARIESMKRNRLLWPAWSRVCGVLAIVVAVALPIWITRGVVRCTS